MRRSILLALLFGALVTGCSQSRSAQDDESAAEPDDQPPMFRVDRNGTGPLTMEELDIHLPPDIDRYLTRTMRACYFDKVQQLAAEAGDPEALDPAEFEFLRDVENWHELTRFGRRLILAQAIASWGMIYC